MVKNLTFILTSDYIFNKIKREKFLVKLEDMSWRHRV